MRSILPIVVACVVGCAALVAYKVLVVGIPLFPEPPPDAFVVEWQLSARVRAPQARATVAIPAASTPGLVDESFANPAASRAIRVRPGRRHLVLTADDGSAALRASYRFGLRGVLRATAESRTDDADLAPSPDVPSDSPAVIAAATADLGTATTDTARVRAQYDFVLDEIANGTPSTAADTLAARAGDASGRVLLFVALLRSLKVPARVVWSLPVVEGSATRLHPWSEVFLDGRWVAVDPVSGRFDEAPPHELDLARGDAPPLRLEGLDDVTTRWSVVRMSAREDATARQLQGDRGVFDALSLDGLSPTNRVSFRVLLLIPLGALLVSLFRNLVGLPTFGTFMPVLVALALRDAPPLAGLAFVLLLVAAGLATRWVLDRLRLLIVPRLSLLLTALILASTSAALLAEKFGTGPSLSVALLPMVVLTMTVERLSLMVVEEGLPNALKALAGTFVVAAACVLVFASDRLQELVFHFPELHLLVVAALLVLGRYTGYRVTEWLRFRTLSKPPGGT